MRIVIVGGTGGIGSIIVNGLLDSRPKHEISVISRSEESVKEAVSQSKRKVKGYVADVTDYKAIKSVFGKIGRFDALINCAGILGPVGSLENSELSAWQNTINVNLMGTVNCCKAAIPFLRKNKRSKIINFAGGGAAFPRIYHTAYASSKAAVVRFTETLAADFQHDKIKIDVNSIAPGAYNTGIWSTETFDKAPDEWADPKHLVKLVRFLLSSRSDGFTGKLIHIKDDYEAFTRSPSSRMDPDLFTLRRIDNFRFKKK
jgi:NAD(P)-dependent dehydrogenase (short-subunit alcohol dehydrogenase family)